MSRPQVKEHNSQTGEEIIREMTDDEFSNYQEFQASVIQVEEDAKAKAAAREALLARLGITEEEAKLLLS